MRKYSLIVITAVLLFSCNKRAYLFTGLKNMDEEQKRQADSLLTYALDHEALYTISDTLKPISSVKLFRLPLLSKDMVVQQKAIDSLRKLYSLINKLNTKELQFILNPFERNDGEYKNLELYVVRNSTMSKVLQQYDSFYGRLGVSENTSPATVLSVTEFENKYDRWRSYGYLFGYPAHAVDFFVEAGKIQDSIGQFVQRNFFAIPVFAGATGYFTYAIPKTYQPTQIDSALYQKAMFTLNKYRKVKEKNNNASAFQLLRKMNKKRNEND